MASGNKIVVSMKVICLEIRIIINKKIGTIIIDSDVIENFITKKYIINRKYFIRGK